MEKERIKNTGKLFKTHYTFDWYDGKDWQSSAFSRTATTSAKERITDLISTYYKYYPTTLTLSSSGDTKGIAKTSKEWEVLFKNTGNRKSYWLASPCVMCGINYAYFAWNFVESELVTGYYLFTSSDETVSLYHSVRPIVSLKSDIQIEKTETKDGSTLAKACIIK